jgi:hypothetical protein
MLLVPLLLLLPADIPADTPAALPAGIPADLQVPAGEPPAPTPASPPWELSLDTFYMDPPGSASYLSAILSADRGQLHLEGRWNYEDRNTGSISVGWSMPWEGEVHGSITPMIGVAAGDTDGIVPAVSLAVNWKSLSFTSEAEYLIGTSSGSQDFVYSWNELTYAFSERFVVGLVGQRTNVFDQDLTIDRGFLVGVALGRTRLTAYVFNPDLDDPYVSLALGAAF